LLGTVKKRVEWKKKSAWHMRVGCLHAWEGGGKTLSEDGGGLPHSSRTIGRKSLAYAIQKKKKGESFGTRKMRRSDREGGVLSGGSLGSPRKDQSRPNEGGRQLKFGRKGQFSSSTELNRGGLVRRGPGNRAKGKFLLASRRIDEPQRKKF